MLMVLGQPPIAGAATSLAHGSAHWLESALLIAALAAVSLVIVGSVIRARRKRPVVEDAAGEPESRATPR